jgi:hypothetical protein
MTATAFENLLGLLRAATPPGVAIAVGMGLGMAGSRTLAGVTILLLLHTQPVS